MSDFSAEFEVIDWESDATNGNEEGYCTGDNMYIDSSIQNFDVRPNELGELYTGVLYIQEHPGWHKRWFTINEHCLKCFRHRTEPKMLFEIPLKGARIIPTDRKKSRVFPIVLSVPRIKESITFAATEENVRQEWKYVLSYVIKRLEDGNSSSDVAGSESKISLTSLLKGKSVYLEEEQKLSANQEPCSVLTPQMTEDGNQQNEKMKISGSSEDPSVVDRNLNWRHQDIKQAERSLTQWQVNVDAEDEMMESFSSPGLEDDESFRELQEVWFSDPVNQFYHHVSISVQIKFKICKNMKSVQQQREHLH